MSGRRYSYRQRPVGVSYARAGKGRLRQRSPGRGSGGDLWLPAAHCPGSPAGLPGLPYHFALSTDWRRRLPRSSSSVNFTLGVFLVNPHLAAVQAPAADDGGVGRAVGQGIESRPAFHADAHPWRVRAPLGARPHGGPGGPALHRHSHPEKRSDQGHGHGRRRPGGRSGARSAQRPFSAPTPRHANTCHHLPRKRLGREDGQGAQAFEKATTCGHLSIPVIGGRGGVRTRMAFRPGDFKSPAYAYSATRPNIFTLVA